MMVVCLILLAALSAAAAQSLPGCPNKCGRVEIPYPFGVGVQSGTWKNCFLEEAFNVTCQNSKLMSGNLEISNISLLQGQMEMSMFVTRKCFDESGGEVAGNTLTLRTPSFTISSSENKFFIVGCDSYGYLRSFQNDRSYATGCLTKCNGVPNEENSKTCSGIGCCQVDIPIGMRNISMEAFSFNDTPKVSDFNNCSYAFVAKRDWFKYSNDFLKYRQFFDTAPLVVDWAVSNGTCKSAQSKPDYACTSNTDCEDTDDGFGYRCKCKPGFDGNPYHPDGCHDVNECKEPSQSARRHNCVSDENCRNRNGSFDCYCPSGYSGNGTREGGCHANNRLTKIFIGVFSSLGSIVFLIGISLLYKLFNKRRIQKRKDKHFKQNGGLLLQQRLSSGEINFDKTKLFNLKDLEKATDHFNVNRVLGKGGQGTVYKGMLTDGKIVAVKKYKVQGNVDEFINEVVILSQVNHRHVVKLLGFCLETKVPLLVYEFIPNGNLFQYLHDRNEENIPMTWEMRLRIATEVAGALFYLHSAASQPIYHRDIKSTNILLDEKYRAKVADFGTSRMVTIEDTHLTTLVQGTFGYLDPEYFHTSQFTEKSDVYSFGVVLVELLTGQKPISSIRPEEAKSLASYFIMNMEEDRVFDVLDRRIMEGGEKEEIMAVANLARRCLELNGRKRPTMKEVTIELEGIQKWGKRSDIAEQSHEEIEVFGIEANQHWGADSTSIESTLNSRTSSSSVVLSLLSNK